jgi:hypothetical protein
MRKAWCAPEPTWWVPAETSGAASSSVWYGAVRIWERRCHGCGLGGGGGPLMAPWLGSWKRDGGGQRRWPRVEKGGEAGDNARVEVARVTGDTRRAPEAAGERRFFGRETHMHLCPFYASRRGSPRDSLTPMMIPNIYL